MISLRNMLSVAVAITAIACSVAPGNLFAATAPNVTYTASGTFASPPISGNDLFQLQGQPFSISVVANAATVPTKHGTHWAVYTKLSMTGTVTSGLLPTPISIANKLTTIELATGNPNYDLFAMFTPVQVVGLTLNIVATIQMPKGTIANALIHPFTAPVTMTPANATMSYSNGTDTTVLGLNGTLNATIPGTTTASAKAMLYSGGAQAISMHGDGTRSVRSIRSAPVELGASNDAVALQFYASGVSGASNVHVQIAGEDVPLLYAGPASHFPGLDQVSVQVPRSLVGRGPVEVVMTVDGQTANPVGLQIQ
jgi:hypothetical protein